MWVILKRKKSTNIINVDGKHAIKIRVHLKMGSMQEKKIHIAYKRMEKKDLTL
jgi:hypothetical protein